MHRSRALFVAALVLLAVGGTIGLVDTRQGLSRIRTTIDGTPVELIVSAEAAAKPRPGVIVVHGFSGSRQLMYGIGQTLARNGYAAALIDLPGHGQNAARFPAQRRGTNSFDRTLTYVMAWLRTVPGVDAEKLALVGHSMGAGAVVRFASRDADVLATVALSGGSPAQGLQRPSGPRNLLAMAGAREPSRIREACAAILTTAYPGAAPGHTQGNWSDGSARGCVIVPGVEHIGVLFSRTSNVAIVRWLDATIGGFPADRPVPTAVPMWPALALHLAGALLLRLLIDGLFRPSPESPGSIDGTGTFPERLPRGAVAIIALAPPMLAVLVMRLAPSGWMPLLTADYLCGFYLITGAAVALGLRQLGLPLLGSALDLSVAWRSMLIAATGLLLFGLVAHHAWLNMWLIAPRGWLAVGVFPVWLVSFVTQDRLLRTRPASEYAAGWIVLTLATTAVLMCGVFLLGAPSFLLLLVPAFVPVLFLQGLYGQWLRARTPSSVPAAVLGAGMFAWLMAAVFPLA